MGNDHEIKQEDLAPRIGTFVLLLGVFAFIFFIASDFVNNPDFDWFLVSILLIAIGIGLRRRAAPRPSAGRFRMIRKIRENALKRREERAKKKK